MTIDLKKNERIDDLQRNHLRIIQKTDGFCFGMDAVLLSGFAAVKPGERVLDLGTGTGIDPDSSLCKDGGGNILPAWKSRRRSPGWRKEAFP